MRQFCDVDVDDGDNSGLLNWYLVVMGPDQKFLTQVRSPSLVWVWIWKIFQFFSLCVKKIKGVGSKSTRVKDGSASYLLQVKRTISSTLQPHELSHNTLSFSNLLLAHF